MVQRERKRERGREGGRKGEREGRALDNTYKLIYI